MRKRVAAALRFTRFRGASVNDLANCLALISLFDGCIKVKNVYSQSRNVL